MFISFNPCSILKVVAGVFLLVYGVGLPAVVLGMVVWAIGHSTPRWRKEPRHPGSMRSDSGPGGMDSPGTGDEDRVWDCDRPVPRPGSLEAPGLSLPMQGTPGVTLDANTFSGMTSVTSMTAMTSMTSMGVMRGTEGESQDEPTEAVLPPGTGPPTVPAAEGVVCAPDASLSRAHGHGDDLQLLDLADSGFDPTGSGGESSRASDASGSAGVPLGAVGEGAAITKGDVPVTSGDGGMRSSRVEEACVSPRGRPGDPRNRGNDHDRVERVCRLALDVHRNSCDRNNADGNGGALASIRGRPGDRRSFPLSGARRLSPQRDHSAPPCGRAGIAAPDGMGDVAQGTCIRDLLRPNSSSRSASGRDRGGIGEATGYKGVVCKRRRLSTSSFLCEVSSSCSSSSPSCSSASSPSRVDRGGAPAEPAGRVVLVSDTAREPSYLRAQGCWPRALSNCCTSGIHEDDDDDEDTPCARRLKRGWLVMGRGVLWLGEKVSSSAPPPPLQEGEGGEDSTPVRTD